MRDLLVQLAVYASLPVIPFRPFLGLLVFSWLAYMRPQDLAWGLRSARFSLFVAVAMFIGLLLHLGRERLVTVRPEMLLLVALWGWMGISVLNGVLPENSMYWFELFGKVVLVSLLTTGLVRTRERFHLLILVIGFSLGLLGLKYGIHGVLRGGARFSQGPGGFMTDNNAFALALNMAVPLLVGIAIVERRRFLKVTALVLALFSILTILFTFSRGGLLTLGVVGGLLLLRSGRPLVAVLVLALGVVAFSQVTSEHFQKSYEDRTDTIDNYQQDGSAMGRIHAWQTALKMARDYPVLGVGPNNFQALYSRYGNPEEARVEHNAFLQMLTGSGIPAVALLLGILGLSLWRLQRVRSRSTEPWAETYARMMQISIIGWSAGAMFLNMAYFDLLYHLFALGVCLEVAALAPGGEEVPEEVAVTPSDAPWWRRSPEARPVHREAEPC